MLRAALLVLITLCAATTAFAQVPSVASVLQVARGVFKPLPVNMATRDHSITPQLV